VRRARPAAAVVLALVLPLGCVGAEDNRFVKRAAAQHLRMVRLGELALERARSEEVRRFARRMVEDHRRASEEARALAERKGLTVATTLSGRSRRAWDRLAGLSGDEFDRAYMRLMVNDHQGDAKTYHKVAGYLITDPRSPFFETDEDVKRWAGRMLPMVEEHRRLAERVAGQLAAPAR
jgi:putative membrane protein